MAKRGRPPISPEKRRVTYANRLSPEAIADLRFIAAALEEEAAHVLERLIAREAKRVRGKRSGL
jgi:hypothetical protein